MGRGQSSSRKRSSGTATRKERAAERAKLQKQYEQAIQRRDQAQRRYEQEVERFSSDAWGNRGLSNSAGMKALRSRDYWQNKANSIQRKINKLDAQPASKTAASKTTKSAAPRTWQRAGDGYYVSKGYSIVKEGSNYVLYNGDVARGNATRSGSFKSLNAAKQSLE